MRRRILKQNKRIRLRRKKMVIKAWLVTGVTLSLIIFVVWGSYNERIRIVNINTEGNEVVLDREIKKIVQTNLAGKYLKIFPKNNIFIYPKKNIKQEILSTFKRISYIKINIINPTSLAITIKERKPYALWCGEVLPSKKEGTKNECYFIDKDGFLFTKSPTFSGDVYFTTYGDIVGKDDPNPLGKEYLGRERFLRLMRLRELLEKEGLSTLRLVEIKNNDFEYYLSSGGKIIFNEQQDIKKLLYNLITAIEVKEKEGKKMKDNLEYIDIRFNNKVIFKFTL